MNNTELKFYGDENGRIYFIENGYKKYITEEEKDKLLLGYIYNNEGELIKTDKVLIKEKKQYINNITEDDLLNSTENFSDLGLKGRDLGKLLINKMLDGNEFKENQYTRMTLGIIISFLENEFGFLDKISEEQKNFILSMIDKDKKTEQILEKFR